MRNPFKKKDDKAKTLEALATIMSMINKLEKKGFLSWQPKQKALFIEQSLATLFMAKGRDEFANALRALALWQDYHLFQEAYRQKSVELETAAVRKAQKEHGPLTDADINRIRQHAREQLEEIDVETLDYLREFDMFIIRADAPSARDAMQSAGQLVALGHFDCRNSQIDMAMYDQVKDTLFKQGKEDE